MGPRDGVNRGEDTHLGCLACAGRQVDSARARGGGSQEHSVPIVLGQVVGRGGEEGGVGSVGRELAGGPEHSFLILASGQDLEDQVGAPAPGPGLYCSREVRMV